MADARIVPADLVLVRVRRVVLTRDVVEEEEIGERLEAVRERAADPERDAVLVADVLRERLPGRRIEHDDAGRSLEAGEEVALPLVVVEAADHALARERE